MLLLGKQVKKGDGRHEEADRLREFSEPMLEFPCQSQGSRGGQNSSIFLFFLYRNSPKSIYKQCIYIKSLLYICVG